MENQGEPNLFAAFIEHTKNANPSHTRDILWQLLCAGGADGVENFFNTLIIPFFGKLVEVDDKEREELLGKLRDGVPVLVDRELEKFSYQVERLPSEPRPKEIKFPDIEKVQVGRTFNDPMEHSGFWATLLFGAVTLISGVGFFESNANHRREVNKNNVTIPKSYAEKSGEANAEHAKKIEERNAKHISYQEDRRKRFEIDLKESIKKHPTIEGTLREIDKKVTKELEVQDKISLENDLEKLRIKKIGQMNRLKEGESEDRRNALENAGKAGERAEIWIIIAMAAAALAVKGLTTYYEQTKRVIKEEVKESVQKLNEKFKEFGISGGTINDAADQLYRFAYEVCEPGLKGLIKERDKSRSGQSLP